MARVFLSSINIILSLLIFQTGFLLKRQELTERSNCGDVQSPIQNLKGCWSPRLHRRVILLVIDALRYDFVYPPDETVAPYRNQMKKTVELLNKNHGTARNMIVDPPTTTLQRIKAMSTGTLPTFIDAGSNFSPDAAVSEDSLIGQAYANNVTVNLLGDNTWLSLYPTQFTNTTAFDSFDIHDLDTVDDAIRPVLAEYMKDTTASGLLIAHFLGIDHTGHKFGPIHPMMTEKLRKMDDIIHETYEALRRDELLIIMGDHGMTQTGDHGGDSDNEVKAALVVLSKEDWAHLPLNVEIKQIDLVPTIALLLGIPIPFSNLGTVITSFFPSRLKKHLVTANYEQIKKFARTYAHRNGFSELHATIGRETSDEAEMLRKIADVQQLLRSVWTQFDLTYMTIGCIGLFEAILFLFTYQELTVETFIFRTGCILLQGALLSDHNDGNLALHLLGLTYFLSSISSLTAVARRLLHEGIDVLSLSTLGFLMVLIHSVSLFSNSYVVYEAKVVHFLVATMSVAAIYKAWRKPEGYNDTFWMADWLLNRKRILDAMIGLLAVLKLSGSFHKCREEEKNCKMKIVHYHISSVEGRFHQILGSTIFMFLLNAYMNAGCPSPPGLLKLLESGNWLLHCLIVSISVLQAVGEIGAKVENLLVYIPWIVYAYSFISILVLIRKGMHHKAQNLYTIPRIFFCLVWVMDMLVGDGIQMPLSLFFFVLLYLVQLEEEEIIPSMVTLLVSLGFYSTGHVPTLSAIPWNAAFVGVPGRLGLRLIPAILVLTHLTISALLTPMVLAGRYFVHPRSIDNAMILMTTRSLASCLAATIHRRHLMVWKIFGPKFIFENVLFIAFMIALNLALVPARRGWKRRLTTRFERKDE